MDKKIYERRVIRIYNDGGICNYCDPTWCNFKSEGLDHLQYHLENDVTLKEYRLVGVYTTSVITCLIFEKEVEILHKINPDKKSTQSV